ncbi:hypothetical protein ACFLZ7_00050 [Nanoarchaeota archaeon]
MNKFWKWAQKNHLLVFVSLIALFLLLWNLDRYLPICPYGTIPAIIAIIFEVYVQVKKRK